jgi:hypothetical protein
MAIKGLAAIKKKAEEKKGFSGDGESPFLSLKDGDSAKIRFLQELDEDSQAYDERRGAVLVLEEHSSPKDFKKTAMCTAETEGRCWACEQTSTPEIGKKWKPKMRFYANVIVRNPDGEDKVKILKRGFSDKDVGNDVINIVEEFEALSDKDLKISRKGSKMNDTSYSLLPLAPKPLTKAEKELELIDPWKFVKNIPYDQQAAFYAGEETEGGSSSEWLSNE